MKKIAIFQYDLSGGGIERSLINLLNQVDLTKIQVDLYLFGKENFFSQTIPKEVNIIYLKAFPNFFKFIPITLLIKLKKMDIKPVDYDIAIDFNTYSPETAVGAIKALSKQKIMWIHNDNYEKHKEELKYKILHFFFKKKYNYFGKFIGVSKGVIPSFKKLNKLNSLNYDVIPNIILSENIIKQSQDKTSFKPDHNKVNFCSIGRLCHQKGFDILLKDIKELIKYRTDFHLYIIGEGEEQKTLENLILKLEISEYVSLLGAKPNPFKYINKCDSFILTSRYEGQGMVILEAKVLGLDIIIPKHLEKYNEGIKGVNSVLTELKNATKRLEKKVDFLQKYNENIIKKFHNL